MLTRRVLTLGALGLSGCTPEATAPVTSPPVRGPDGTITEHVSVPIIPTTVPLRGGRFVPPVTTPPPAIPAVLRLPVQEGRRPAVVVVHGTSGVQTGGPARYARMLTEAGFATLETDSWTPRGVNPAIHRAQRPGTFAALPDIFGALRFLANHPRVDPARIGITGFSWGGIMALRTAREDLQAIFLGADGPRFRAHVAFYPICSHWAPDAGATAGEFDRGWPRAPLLILAAGREDYDRSHGAADCTAYLDAIPGGRPAQVTLHIYQDATHGWDVGAPQSAWDPAARNLAGGTVTMTPDPAVTADAQNRLLAFMRQHLGHV